MLSEKSFRTLFHTLMTIDHGGESGPAYPFDIPPTAASLKSVIAEGARTMPLLFQKSYVAPLLSNLDTVIEMSNNDHTLIETLAGAAYQHHQPELAQPLHRFLAVVSDLFRSFLSRKRRTAVEFPLRETIPPLAMFQRDGANGPFTYTCDDIQRYTGGNVGVVSLPAVYRTHPILWSTLAHETGGHDVIHADANLLPELEEGVKTLFGGGPIRSQRKLSQPQSLGLLWSYWMEEASADVYAILNMGPTFALNSAAYCAAIVSHGLKRKNPILRTESGFSADDPGHTLDPHPTDLLRLSLMAGVIESLEGLTRAQRDAYLHQLDMIAKVCAPDATAIKITGIADAGAGTRVPIDLSLPLEDMRTAASKVGTYVATAKLKALGGNSIQQLETWDDFDESAAAHIAERFEAASPAGPYGDDAQLLAGANLAVFAHPDQYAAITQGLEQALDQSYAIDSYWSPIQRDHFLILNTATNH